MRGAHGKGVQVRYTNILIYINMQLLKKGGVVEPLWSLGPEIIQVFKQSIFPTFLA